MTRTLFVDRLLAASGRDPAGRAGDMTRRPPR